MSLRLIQRGIRGLSNLVRGGGYSTFPRCERVGRAAPVAVPSLRAKRARPSSSTDGLLLQGWSRSSCRRPLQGLKAIKAWLRVQFVGGIALAIHTQCVIGATRSCKTITVNGAGDEYSPKERPRRKRGLQVRRYFRKKRITCLTQAA
jgi:hypothetical protein